ncbi:MAG TPA: hypothetical protein VFW11_07255 [Cyclobacteriaceae bacterium]|nr:hypothetical protein [Cyclobacteriaceae bacterium]
MSGLLATMAITFGILSANAQSAQFKIKVKETEIPLAVIESFKKDYKGHVAGEWSIAPARIIGEEYVVADFDNPNGKKTTMYTVAIKGSLEKEEAVYDASGKLLYSKKIIRDETLPTAVRKTIVLKYPDYAIHKDSEIIKTGKSVVTHYRVVVEKGTDERAVAVNESGKIIKEIRFRL